MPKQEHPAAALGVVAVVLTLVGWSSIPLFLRHFAHSIDAWTSNGWRYGFSALVWAPVLVWAWNRAKLPRGLWAAALVPSLVNAAGQVCFTWAHYRIEPALLTFGLRCQLIFVAIGAWMLIPAERAIIRRPGYLAGAAILLLGMSAVLFLDKQDTDESTKFPTSRTESSVSSPSSDSSSLNAEAADLRFQIPDFKIEPSGFIAPKSAAAHLEGVALALGSGLLFAGYGLAVRKYMHGVNSVIAFAAICQYTALAMIGLMFAFGERGGASVFNMPSNQIILLLTSALIGIAIGHVFYYFSIARLGVAVAAGILQLQPFIVAIGSMALFSEMLSPMQWSGGMLAVGGAVLMLAVQWKLSRKAPAIEEPVAIAEGESGS